MCQEIMAPQVEYGEGTPAPTEADETQQQPEKSRCACRVYPRACMQFVVSESECVFVHALVGMQCLFFVCVCVCVCMSGVYISACQRSHFLCVSCQASRSL